MKKIFIGGYGACDVHNESSTIIMLVRLLELELVTRVEDADLIIIVNTCIGNFDYISKCIKMISNVEKRKKEGSPLIVSGCLANGIKAPLNNEDRDFLNRINLVPSKELINYVLNLIYKSNNLNTNLFKGIPFTQQQFEMRFSPVEGCLNNCSFCKVAFQNFPLTSYSLEELDRLIYTMSQSRYPITFLDIFSSNFSLYGVDLYGKSMAHEVIRKVATVESVRYISCGALINFSEELLAELISNPKIRVVNISLESGSPRIYNLMNRPVTFSKWVEIVKYIRANRPDIMIKTELIAGFPTETVTDIQSTLSLVEELDLYVTAVWEYQCLRFTESSKLPQHSISDIRRSKEYYDKRLKTQNELILKKYARSEAYVADYNDKRDECILVYPDGLVLSLAASKLKGNYKIGDVIYFDEDGIKVTKKQLIQD